MQRRLLLALVLVVAALLTASPACDGDADGDSDADGDEDVEDLVCQVATHADRQGVGPLLLLGETAFADRPSGLGVDLDAVEHQRLDVASLEVHVFNFEVTVFESFAGRDWVHPVTLVAPAAEDLAALDSVAASASVGTLNPVGGEDDDPTWGAAHPSWFRGTDTTQAFLLSFGSVVESNRIPMVFTNIVPEEIELSPEVVEQIHELRPDDGTSCESDCTGVLTADEDIRACLSLAALATGDLTYDSSLLFAVAESRILDAAEIVLEAGYGALGSNIDLEWSRIWSIGSSKRGNAQRVLAAVDPRVVGVIVSAADISSIVDFFELQYRVWDVGYALGGPTFGDLLQDARYRPWLETFDSALWNPDALHGVEVAIIVGTNDHLYPLASSLLYVDTLPVGSRVQLVPNYGHGQGTVDHVAALRALVANGLEGVAWPRIEATWDVENDLITASVSDDQPLLVELWCTTSFGDPNEMVYDRIPPDCDTLVRPEVLDGLDLRHALWESSEMEQHPDGSYQSAPLSSELSTPACLVRAVFDGEKTATSLPLLSRELCLSSGLSLD